MIFGGSFPSFRRAKGHETVGTTLSSPETDLVDLGN